MASTNVMFREPPGTTGSARHLSEREAAPRTSEANVGQVERVASAALGGTLLMLGLGRRSLGGAAVDGIASDLAVARAALGNASDRLSATKAQLQDTLDGVETADPSTVATKLLATQTRLQASYQTTSLISKLSLVNYI